MEKVSGYDRIVQYTMDCKAPLQRYFRKVTLLQDAILKLERFARSPRMHRILKKKLQVETLDPTPQQINLPSTRVLWQQLFDGVMDICGMQPNPKLSAGLIDQVSRTFEGSQVGQAPVHCKCRILEHFTSQKHKVPPVSYIGVSKLSCAACSAIFDASNAETHHRFYTHGSHSKWYFPWGMPAVGDKVASAAYSTLARQLGNSLSSMGIAHRRLSDSSAGSAESGDLVAGDDDSNPPLRQPRANRKAWFVPRKFKKH